jgi:hypothetical protein
VAERAGLVRRRLHYRADAVTTVWVMRQPKGWRSQDIQFYVQAGLVSGTQVQLTGALTDEKFAYETAEWWANHFDLDEETRYG